MSVGLREFQIFAKPVGALCNLNCRYCYYLKNNNLLTPGKKPLMDDRILEKYVVQHIQTSSGEVIMFSWHGGEPLMAGIEFFRRVTALQRKHWPDGRRIVNGIQTNGTLIDEKWCRFLADEKFVVGISIDGPGNLHDMFRLHADGRPSFSKALKGYRMLLRHGIVAEILCVVNAFNVREPLRVYRFLKDLGAGYITFLPLVERCHDSETEVSEISVPAREFGEFLITVFDEWVEKDIGKIKVQIFEEAIRPAFGQEHTLCIFKETCGGVPVMEYNGNFYSCDHYVDSEHFIGNILSGSLSDFLDSPQQVAFGERKKLLLPDYCVECEVRAMCNGECPKNRFIKTPDGDEGLNYLCEGYKVFFRHSLPFVKAVRETWKNKCT
ncbi:MAG: anaerobic sulfatase maturase [Bacteroidota bacterium]|nr:anaerobic sulfatase maturase [Bacteroidota bacterium]